MYYIIMVIGSYVHVSVSFSERNGMRPRHTAAILYDEFQLNVTGLIFVVFSDV